MQADNCRPTPLYLTSFQPFYNCYIIGNIGGSQTPGASPLLYKPYICITINRPTFTITVSQCRLTPPPLRQGQCQPFYAYIASHLRWKTQDHLWRQTLKRGEEENIFWRYNRTFSGDQNTKQLRYGLQHHSLNTKREKKCREEHFEHRYDARKWHTIFSKFFLQMRDYLSVVSNSRYLGWL